MAQQVNIPSKVINLHDIPEIEFYKKTHQLMMSEQNKRIIKEKLHLQKQSIRNTRQREKLGDYFIKFERNPFTDLSFRVPTSQNKKTIQKRQQPEKNLINELFKKRQNRVIKPAFLQRFKEIDQQLLNAYLLSEKLVSTTKMDKKQTQQKQNNLKQQNVEEDKTQLAETDIDSILKIKDQNFFLKKSKTVNIFQYGLGQPFDSVQKQLQKHYFSFVSVIQKIQKIKIPIYRDISRMGRRVILDLSTGKDNIIDYVDSYQLSFKTNQLLFQDIMSVASGRFSPQFVYKAINFEGDYTINKQTSDVSSTQQIITTFYRQEQENKQCKFTNGNEQAQQIVDYLKLDLNQKEKKYDGKCLRERQKIASYVQMMERLVLLTIKDQKLHKNLQKQVAEKIEEYINMDRRNGDEDRKIRHNKRYKQKQESIKLERMLQAIQLLNEHKKKMGNVHQEIRYPSHGLGSLKN